MRTVDELADFFDEAAPVSGWFIDFRAVEAAFEDLGKLPLVVRASLRLMDGLDIEDLHKKFMDLHREPPFSEQWSGLAKALRALPPGIASLPPSVTASGTEGLFGE